MISGLAAGGKRTVTGVCGCVGIGGVVLGGGLGFHQGQYGLMADQLIPARIVLANGTAAFVSAESHPDLLWALLGAGHNFGIFTDITTKVYDIKVHENWAFEAFNFWGDQLEGFFEALNAILHTQPAEMVGIGFMRRDAEVDPINVGRDAETDVGQASIGWVVVYDGQPLAVNT